MNPNNLHKLVTFEENKTLPVYSWFYFKEGYSKNLIYWLKEKYELNGVVLDPFCGSGTTLLAGKELGLRGIGFDVLPVAVLASKVKTRNYEVNELKKEFNKITDLKIKETEVSFVDKKIRKLFYSKNLQEIVFYWNEIKKIKNEVARDFFFLALVSITGRASNTIKAGGSLRKKKNRFVSVRKLFLKQVKKMIDDLREQKGKEPELFLQDARYFELEKESIDSIITSPPYLNKIEYASVYKLELGLFFNQKTPLLKSFLGDDVKEVFPEFEKMPLIAQAYFNDMKKVLRNSFECLKKGGRMFIIVAGGCLHDRTIQSDEIIGSLAEDEGFKLIEIITCREIGCMKNRTQLMGKVRESIIVLEKN